MAKKLLKYINSYRDASGVMRHYFRKRGISQRIPLPGEPGSREFMAAYQMALEATDKPVIVGAGRDPAGSFGTLLTMYYQSVAFKDLQPQTQKNFRFILERFRSRPIIKGEALTFGHVQVKDFRRAHIAKVMDGMAETPGAARNLRNRLRRVLTFTIERELI